MTFVMLVAGIGLVAAGLLAIGFGIPIKEFSTGNTLIMAGVIGICTGVIMLGLWVAVRELKNIARRIGSGLAVEAREDAAARPAPAAEREAAPVDDDFPADDPFGEPRARPSVAPSSFSPAVPPPWQNEAVLRDHPIPEPLHPEPPPPPPPEAKPKRNLMFSSSSRKERERALGRSGETLPPDLMTSDLRSRPPVVPPLDTAEPSHESAEDSWPRADRAPPDETPPPRRGVRIPSMPARAAAVRVPDQPEVMVLKSGIVDGMAYSLYSDGSIEAQMPEGMMRFASIDELRVHLDQRS